MTTNETPVVEKAPEKEPVVPETTGEDRVKVLEERLKGANHEAEEYRKKIEKFEQEEAKRKEAEMSELDLAKKRAADAEKKAQELEAQSLRRQAAEEAGLPLALMSRLQGATLDELKADALKLAEVLPKADIKKVAPTINATNPANPDGVETDAQKRERLFGKRGNPFDMEVLKAKGGGVKLD